MKKKPTKLTLNRETIASLEKGLLREGVLGGVGTFHSCYDADTCFSLCVQRNVPNSFHLRTHLLVRVGNPRRLVPALVPLRSAPSRVAHSSGEPPPAAIPRLFI